MGEVNIVSKVPLLKFFFRGTKVVWGSKVTGAKMNLVLKSFVLS